jgi:hypothetical protein
MRVRAVAVAGLCASACAPKPPLRAIVEVGAPDGSHVNPTVLAMPTQCASDDARLCELSYLYSDKSMAPRLSFDEIIAPLVRVKLELAGYTLVDPRTLRLETAERTDVTHDGETQIQIDETPTVAMLSLPETVAAANSIHLGNILLPTVRASRENYRVVYELILELRGLPDGVLRWTARCREIVDQPAEAANLLANCVGDAVLAWRAPDAAIGVVR